MGWFNYYGLIAIIVIMIPNIVVAIIDKTQFENKFCNKGLSITEQIGRYACMLFMVFNIPYTYFGFWFDNALLVYLLVDGILLLLYCIGWTIFFKKQCLIKALWLSITPTIIFLFSGVVLSSIPLIIFSVVFGVGHIAISLKNILNN